MGSDGTGAFDLRRYCGLAGMGNHSKVGLGMLLQTVILPVAATCPATHHSPKQQPVHTTGQGSQDKYLVNVKTHAKNLCEYHLHNIGVHVIVC